MNNRKSKLFWVIVCMVWFGVIFLFSQSNGTESHGTSSSVTSLIGSVMNPEFSSWSNAMKAEWVGSMNSVIRKCAHFVEYFVAGMLVFSTVNAFMSDSGRCKQKRTRRVSPVMVSFYLCLLMAGVDELHQLYVEGRTNSVLDVVLDCVGIAAGIAMVYDRAKRKAASRKMQTAPRRKRVNEPYE